MVMLATPEELASYLKQDLDTATAEQAIAIASGQVETLTGIAFTERTATITVPAQLALYLTIPVRPVRSVNSVTIGGQPYADFSLTASGLYRARGWGHTWPVPDVVMTVTYGTESVPDDVKGVVLEMAGFAYDGRSGVSSESVDDYRVSYTGQISSASRATLAAYGADAGTVLMISR